jgi:phosphoesterase RecJ-like protein
MAIPKTDIYKYELKTGDTEGLVNYLLSIQGIRLAAIVIDREEERKWSFRSKGLFDVNIFARNHFEGGGHANAAGGKSSKSIEETASDFAEVIKMYKNQLTQ